MPAFLRMVDTLRNEKDRVVAGSLDGIFIPHLRGAGRRVIPGPGR
jgi:hypothetical protein